MPVWLSSSPRPDPSVSFGCHCHPLNERRVPRHTINVDLFGTRGLQPRPKLCCGTRPMCDVVANCYTSPRVRVESVWNRLGPRTRVVGPWPQKPQSKERFLFDDSCCGLPSAAHPGQEPQQFVVAFRRGGFPSLHSLLMGSGEVSAADACPVSSCKVVCVPDRRKFHGRDDTQAETCLA